MATLVFIATYLVKPALLLLCFVSCFVAVLVLSGVLNAE